MNYRKLVLGEEEYLTKMEVYNVPPTEVDLKTDAHLSIIISPFWFTVYDVQATGTIGKEIYISPMWKDLAVLLEELNQDNPSFDNEDKIRSVYFYSTGKTAVVDKTYKLQEAFRILLTLNTSALGLHTGDLIDIGVPQDFPFFEKYRDLYYLRWDGVTFGVPTQFKVIAPNKAIAVCDTTIDNSATTSSPDARELFVAFDYEYWEMRESSLGDSTYEDNLTKESPKYLPKWINQYLAKKLEYLKLNHKAFWRNNNVVRIGSSGSPNLTPTWDNVRIYEGKNRSEILSTITGMAGTTNIDSLEIVYNDEGDSAAQINEVKNAVVSFAEQQVGICRVVLYMQTYDEYTEGNFDYQVCVGQKAIDGWSGTDWQAVYDAWQEDPTWGEPPKNVPWRYFDGNTRTTRRAWLPSEGEFKRLTEYSNRTNTVSRLHT